MSSSLFDYLERWRGRPEPARRRALVLASSVLTLIIFLLWLLNLKYVGPLSETALPATVSIVRPEVSTTNSFQQALTRIKSGWQILLQRVIN